MTLKGLTAAKDAS